MFGWLFPRASKQRSRGWNDTNIFRDIGEGMGKGGPGRRGGGGGRRQARPNRCGRCPALESKIAQLKEQNSALRKENALLRQKVKRRDKKIKGAPKGHPGSPEWYRSGLRQILNVLNTRARFSDYHIPKIRQIVNQRLGTNSQWDGGAKQ